MSLIFILNIRALGVLHERAAILAERDIFQQKEESDRKNKCARKREQGGKEMNAFKSVERPFADKSYRRNDADLETDKSCER